MKTLHYQPYIDELNALTSRMLEAEEFAERLPLFKDYILKNKIYDIKRNTLPLGEKVLDVYFGQMIYFYNLGMELTNYKHNPIEIPLVVFYINRYSMFGDDFYDNIDKELDASVDDLVYFYDSINSKYYVAEENLEEFCSKLSIWYNNAIDKNKQYSIDKKKIRLQKELDLLQG